LANPAFRLLVIVAYSPAYTLLLAPCTLYLVPFTLRLVPCVLRLVSGIFNGVLLSYIKNSILQSKQRN
jgi:hypothetical protein